MSDKLKIKLTLADLVYPMTITADQEASLRASAKKIDAMIKQLEENYAVRDKQDVLAMCALQYAAQLEKQIENKEVEGIESIKINEFIELIDNQSIQAVRSSQSIPLEFISMKLLEFISMREIELSGNQ